MADSQEAFPRDQKQYEQLTVVGSTTTTTMYTAKYANLTTRVNAPVGIKVFDIEKIEDIYCLTLEVHESETLDHENIVRLHCSFKTQNQLWVILPSLSRYSLRSTIQSNFPNGISKINVSLILKEALAGLNYMHVKNKLHQSLDAGCIFLDSKSRVKIAFRSLTYEENHYPSWAMAPELMSDYRKPCSTKASDVWTLGLLALELFYGRIPASDFEEFTFLLSEIKDDFGRVKKKGNKIRHVSEKLGFFSCFGKGLKKIPRALGEFMAACFVRDPRKRKTTNQLMEFELFQNFDEEKRVTTKLNKAWK